MFEDSEAYGNVIYSKAQLDEKFDGIDIQIRCLHEDIEDLKREVIALRKYIKAFGHIKTE